VTKPSPALTEEARPRFAAARPRLAEWFRREARALPWRPPHPLALPSPGDALAAGLGALRPLRSPYAVWISEIMLQQTQVATVVPYFERWMEKFPTPAALAAAPEDEVLRAWAGLGYYARARNLQKAARVLAGAGAYPDSGEGWKALPGIGDYTAGAIASLALGLRAPLLDGNVARVFSRLLALEFLPTDDAAARAAYWALAAQWVGGADDSRADEVNEGLMELGARVCVPVSPRCGECPVRPQCVAAERGWQDRLPPARARAKVEAVPAVAVLARAAGPGGETGRARVLLERRAKGFLAGHELFPFFLGEEAGDWRAAFARRFPGLTLSRAEEAGAVRHAIMSKRYDVRVWRCEVSGEAPEGAWREAEGLEAALTSGLAKKIWKEGSRTQYTVDDTQGRQKQKHTRGETRGDR
jgi:A/G-specific adenine glycosylase